MYILLTRDKSNIKICRVKCFPKKSMILLTIRKNDYRWNGDEDDYMEIYSSSEQHFIEQYNPIIGKYNRNDIVRLKKMGFEKLIEHQKNVIDSDIDINYSYTLNEYCNQNIYY